MNGRTPLMQAAAKGDAGAARLLLDAGAGVDHRDGEGATALTLAAFQGHTAAVQLLVERWRRIGCSGRRRLVRADPGRRARPHSCGADAGRRGRPAPT